MFSLIITIISIAFVVALVAISAYYGGSNLSEAEAQAEATRLKNEEQQILAAVESFNAQNGHYPRDIEELVQARYLSTVPMGVREVAAASTPEFIRMAIAQSASAGWGTPVAGTPIFMTAASVPLEVCRKYNLLSRGDDGILRQPFDSLPSQCYGSDGIFRLVVMKADVARAMLSTAVAPTQVAVGGLPSVDTGDTWWEMTPTGPIKAVVDDGKRPYAQLSLHPTTAESYGDVQVGGTRTSASRTLINMGNIAAQSVGVQVPEGFQLTNNSCASGLAPGASCSFSVDFMPAQAQLYSGEVTVGSANGGTLGFSVSGTGRMAGATLSSIAFGNLAAGAVTTREATLQNTGVGSLALGAPTVEGSGYAVAGTTCGQSLAAGASCAIQVSYTPFGASQGAGTLSISATPVGVLAAALTGQSQQATVSASPATREFGPVQVGQAGTSVIALSNTGNIAATGLTFTPPAGYILSDSTCSSTLAASANCSFAVMFSPVAAEAYNGSLTITTDNANSAVVALTGTGVAPTATLTGIAFGNLAANADTTREATLQNTGIGPLNITKPTASSISGSGFSFLGTTCASSLAPNASCTVSVRYTASGSEAASGTLTITTNAGNKYAALSGQSQQAKLSVTPTKSYLGTVDAGDSSTTGTHILNNMGNLPATDLNFAPPPGFSMDGNTCGNTLEPGASCQFRVKFSPTENKSYTAELLISSSNVPSLKVLLNATGYLPWYVYQTADNAYIRLRQSGYALMTTPEAISACSSFSYKGVGGWRMPSIQEAIVMRNAMASDSVTLSTHAGSGGNYVMSSSIQSGQSYYGVTLREGTQYSSSGGLGYPYCIRDGRLF
ncbi:MAG: choice-of-anchor D domain-containing protein [Roseateles sp.]|uniref:choice-of-anchor D domain-containing protein n=1 Tax=Roseateles sp. TaxID=1971397 RepID=UPI0039E8023E